MRLNLNDNIRVKLTEHGKDIYYHQYDRTNKLLGREVCKPSYPKVDEDGYTTFQLWCFIELYGIHMGMTLPNVIEPLDIVFDAPTIEPERKTDRDTISRQAAIDEITEYGSGDTIYMSVAEFKRRIEHLPPAQPERKTGKWLMDGEKCGELMWRCSECEVSEAVPTATSFVSGIAYPQWKFCPNCGAKMEEGDHT